MCNWALSTWPQVEERSKLNRQSSPALQHKVANRISDPSLPPRSESFSSGGIQQARTPPMHRSIEPQVSTCHTVGVGGTDGQSSVRCQSQAKAMQKLTTVNENDIFNHFCLLEIAYFSKSYLNTWLLSNIFEIFFYKRLTVAIVASM